jgi:hypothetical protein
MTASSLYERFDRLLNARFTGLFLSLSVLILLFKPVFYAHYAFLDEAYQLWHNRDDSNFTMDLVQGRLLTGLIFLKTFASIPTIAGLKIMRIISFFSWALFLVEFFRLGEKWRRVIGFDRSLLTISGVYIASSLSLAIYIGWGVCLQIGLACLLGLWAGHLLFITIMGQGEKTRIILLRMISILILSLLSFFLYQPAFAMFLFPLAVYLIIRRSGASLRILLTGVGTYLILTLLYYLLFRYSLKGFSVPPSSRAGISLDPLGKLGFFFSAPLSQAFSLNFLYNMHSILSQAFPILMIAAWLILYIKMDPAAIGKKMIFISLFLVLCMCIYLPVLVARENFASYRTMFVFNLVVTFFLTDLFLSLFRSVKWKALFSAALLCCFIGVGYRNFRLNFIDPLREEYGLLRQFVDTHYDHSIRTVYFMRPAEDLFHPRFGINAYKDEFGVPSTFRDWTPESLLKQVIFENTGDRALADSTAIIQFTDRASFTAQQNKRQPDALYIDMEAIFPFSRGATFQ